MAVFTEVGLEEAGALLSRLGLGELHTLRGIEGGIENTNYFASTERGEFVLTLFERLGFEQLPYYLCLMKHLADRGLPVPAPAADPALPPGMGALAVPANAPCEFLHTVQGKPAAVVQRLEGRSVLAPTAAHCAELGRVLARMHLAGRDFPRLQPNLRGLAWWNETAPIVLPYLDAAQAALLQGELAYQNHVADASAYAALPRGPIHADLFRDNALFAEDGDVATTRLTGVFDFYFAGTDTWLFDLAVCLNDWAVDLDSGRDDPPRRAALLAAYATVRPLTAAERTLLPAMLRAAALRFWISRLWDFHLPREATLLKPHDPRHFERVLRGRARPSHAAPSRRAARCGHRLTSRTMRLHIVPARTGIVWLRLGLKTFTRQPLAYISLFFFFMALASIVSMVPLVGSVLTMLLLPAITLAMMAATAQASGPDKPAPGLVFVAALQAVRQDARPLLALGVIYAACFLAVIAISVLIDGGDFARVYLLGEPATLEMAQARNFQIALWVTMALSLPLSLAFWHAPALVHWHGVAPVKSIFFSVVACLRNFGAFTVFGLMWFGVLVVAAIVLSLMASMLIVLGGMGREGAAALGGALMIGGMLVMAAMFFSSLWFTFRDSFDAD